MVHEDIRQVTDRTLSIDFFEAAIFLNEMTEWIVLELGKYGKSTEMIRTYFTYLQLPCASMGIIC